MSAQAQLLLLFVVCTGEQLSALMERPPVGPRANKNTAEMVNGINTKHAHRLASFNPIHTERLLGAGCKGPNHENTALLLPAATQPPDWGLEVLKQSLFFLSRMLSVPGPISGPSATHSL